MSEELTLHMDQFLPLRDVVFQTLREAILQGRLKPGDRLMEIQLANQLGVSRTPIREAIRMLEQEGLAITVPRKGAQVAKMSEKDMEDVLETREVLDSLAVSKACERMTAEDLENLRAARDRFEDAVGVGDTRKIAEADVAFHDVIYRASNNPKLVNILYNLREQMYRYRLEYIKDNSVYDTLIQEQRALVDGFERRDRTFLVDTMHTHLQKQLDAVARLIRSQRR